LKIKISNQEVSEDGNMLMACVKSIHDLRSMFNEFGDRFKTIEAGYDFINLRLNDLQIRTGV
jgi:hypothetical protein